MTTVTQTTTLSFCPSSMKDFLSISYEGKTYELPYWQKTAIIITSIAGIALFGVGILFGLGLSYYFRNKLVEQIASGSPTSIQIVPPQISEPRGSDPVVIIDPPKPTPEPQPILTDTGDKTAPTAKQTDPVVVTEPLKPTLAPQPTLTDPATTTQTKQDPKPIEIAALLNPQKIQADAAIAADRVTKKEVEEIRAAIDETRHMVIKLSKEYINGKTLDNWSMEGRHFLSITNGIRGHKIPGFSPLLLPKGIYCIYFTNKDDITNEWMRVDEYSQMIIDKFGTNNIYHLVICEHEPQWNVSRVKKMHKHQLELYSKKDINDPINQRCIKEFEQHFIDINKQKQKAIAKVSTQ